MDLTELESARMWLAITREMVIKDEQRLDDAIKLRGEAELRLDAAEKAEGER